METKVFASVCVCVCAALVRPSNALTAALPHKVGAAPTSTSLSSPPPQLSCLPFSFLSRFFLVVQLLKLFNAHLQSLKGVFVCVSLCVCCLVIIVVYF